MYLYPMKYKSDDNYHMYFDTETSPTYYIREVKKQKVENCKVITDEEYVKYQELNKKYKNKKYDIGSYSTTKMLSLKTENNIELNIVVNDEDCQFNVKPQNVIFVKNEVDLKIKFWDFIFEIIQQCKKEKKKKIRMFSHNATFDIKQVGFFSNKNISLVSEKYNKQMGICIDKPFFINFVLDDYVLSFEDSMNFFNTSLKKLGKDIGLPKLDYKFDFNPNKFISNDESMKYCIRDRDIIHKAIEDLRTMINENKFGKLGITIAQTAFSIFLTSFNPKCINTRPRDLSEMEIRKIIIKEFESYHGGRTEAFKLGVYENIYYYDENSMYPSAMYNLMPTQYITTFPSEMQKEIFNINKVDDIKIREFLKKKNIYGIYRCIIKTNKNDLPVFEDNKLKFIKSVKGIEILLHEPEFKYFYESIDYEIIVLDVQLYKSAYIFTEYIDHFKKMKETAKNPTERQFAKNMLNNLYGKFGQKERATEIIELDELQVGRHEVIEGIESSEMKLITYDCYGSFAFRTEILDNTPSTYSFPAVAGAVTSYARLDLLKMINELGRENILYCDTDSLMSTVPMPDKYLDDNIFGLWKNEGIGLNNTEKLNVLIKGCKNYIIYDNEYNVISVKSKGIKKTSIEIGDNTFYQKKFWSVKTTKVKKESIFTLEHTVIEDELKVNKNRYTKGIVMSKEDKKIKLKFKDENGNKKTKEIKYTQAKIKPFDIDNEVDENIYPMVE